MTNLFSCHINKKDNIQQFAQKQLDLFQYSQDKYAYMQDRDVTERRRARSIRENVMSDPTTQRLIKRFIYMRDNGIFDKIFNNKK